MSPSPLTRSEAERLVHALAMDLATTLGKDASSARAAKRLVYTWSVGRSTGLPFSTVWGQSAAAIPAPPPPEPASPVRIQIPVVGGIVADELVFGSASGCFASKAGTTCYGGASL